MKNAVITLKCILVGMILIAMLLPLGIVNLGSPLDIVFFYMRAFYPYLVVIAVYLIVLIIFVGVLSADELGEVAMVGTMIALGALFFASFILIATAPPNIKKARLRKVEWVNEKREIEVKKQQEAIAAEKRRQHEAYLKTPAGQLEAKAGEARDLRMKLEGKNRELAATRGGFRKDIRDLRREILQAKNEKGIRSYTQASGDSRINNNLSLIQTKLAYIEKLDQVEVRIKAGIEELVLQERTCEDKAEFLKVFGDEDMAGIIRGIDVTIEKYLPESGKLVVDTKGVRLRPTEDIWSDIVNGRL